MSWLLMENKIIALDKFNTILDPIMTYFVIVLLILATICFVNHMEYKLNGWHILKTKTSNNIKVVLVLVLVLVTLVCITNAIQHYAEELMMFDGYMYIDYKKEIIKMQ